MGSEAISPKVVMSYLNPEDRQEIGVKAVTGNVSGGDNSDNT